MKYVNLIKLLSVLLCIVMLMSACQSIDTEEDTADTESSTDTGTGSENHGSDKETEEPTEEPEDDTFVEVEAKLENFVELKYENAWDELLEAERIDDIYSYDENIFIIKDAEIDHLNMVTETFSVYNRSLGKIVYTISNKYENLEYSTFDWNRSELWNHDARLPESIVSVISYGAGIIEVSRAKLTRADEQALEDNPEMYAYTAEVVREYYDSYGTKLGELKGFENRAVRYSLSGDAIVVNIGEKRVVVDIESGKLLRTVDAHGGVIIGGFDYENSRYGYFYARSSQTGLGNTGYVEVYRKATEKLTRYNFERGNQSTEIFYLQNGDVVIQTVDKIFDEAGVHYDFAVKNESSEKVEKFTVKTLLIDVSEQTSKEIDVDFVISSMYERDKFTELFNVEKTGVSFTDNAWNIAIASGIKDKKLEGESIVMFNNEMKSLFELEPMSPEHKLTVTEGEQTSLGIRVLATGDLLIAVSTESLSDMNGAEVGYAIITTAGDVRCYLKPDSKVVGNYIVNDNGIYDFDMKLKHSFEANEQTLVGSIGDSIIVTMPRDRWDWSESLGSYVCSTEDEYFSICGTKSDFVATEIFDGETVYMIDDNYVRTYKDETYGGHSKHTMYNAALEHVLTTNDDMTVIGFEGGYLVTSYIEGESVRYVVKLKVS